MGLLILRSSAVGGDALTGLEFPSNDGTTSVRFHFGSPPSLQPLTIIWKINPTQQTGFYTTWFWGEEGGQVITSWAYVGCHPYPPGGAGGSTHNWEIAIDGDDDTTDENANDTTVTKGQWYDQSAIMTLVNTDELDVKFYWNLSVSNNRLIQHTTTVSDYLGAGNQPSNPGLFFGDAPWSEGDELLSGILRGVQVYSSALTLAQVEARAACDTDAEVLALNTTDGITSLWYLNMNPTPDDITDKSGEGNNPSWANANRPTLWEG